MAMNLQDILPGIGRRGLHHNDENFVNRTPGCGVNDLPIMKMMETKRPVLSLA